MDGAIRGYRERCEENVRVLTEKLNADRETAYAMLLTASIMTDLSPADEDVVRIVLKDCGAGEHA